VVRRPGVDRRSPMRGYAVDEAFARSREVFARAVEWLAGPEAAGLDHAAVEEGLAARGREMQRLLFQDYLDGRAAAEPGREAGTGPGGVGPPGAPPRPAPPPPLLPPPPPV